MCGVAQTVTDVVFQHALGAQREAEMRRRVAQHEGGRGLMAEANLFFEPHVGRPADREACIRVEHLKRTEFIFVYWAGFEDLEGHLAPAFSEH